MEEGGKESRNRKEVRDVTYTKVRTNSQKNCEICELAISNRNKNCQYLKWKIINKGIILIN
jgi:hypothetical protein